MRTMGTSTKGSCGAKPKWVTKAKAEDVIRANDLEKFKINYKYLVE